MQEPAERPKGDASTGETTEIIQLWTNTTEACPEGTIPIRRTSEEDVSRASSIQKFGRKFRRRDTTSSDHEVSKLQHNLSGTTALSRCLVPTES